MFECCINSCCRRCLLVAISIALHLSFSTAVTRAQQPVEQLQSLMAEFQAANASGDLEKASTVAGQLIPVGEQLMGAGNPNVIRLGITQGVLLRNLGRYDEAEVAVNRALKKAKSNLGDQHPVTALAINTIGSVKRMRGELAEAKTKYEQAIEILDRHGDEALTEKSDAYANYSDLLQEMGDFARARDFVQQALEMNRRKFGAKHQRTLSCLNNLGMVQLSLGDNAAAEKTLTESLKLHEQLFGKEHAEVATSLNNLGKLYVARGKYELATQSYRRAYEIHQAQFGDDHPTTITINNNLGQLLTEQGKLDEALPILKDTLQRRIKTDGEDHPSTATTQHNLGGLLLDLQSYDEARPLLESSASYFESEDSQRLSGAAGSRAYLGVLETNAGNVPEAIKQFDLARRDANDAAWRVLPELSNNEQQKFMQSTFDWTLYAGLSLAMVHPNDEAVLSATAEWAANGKGIATTALGSKRKRTKNLRWVKLQEIRSALPADGIWIDIVRQDKIDFQATGMRRLGDPNYVAWIVRPQGETPAVARVDLGDAETIETGVENMRQAIRVTAFGSNAASDVNDGKNTDPIAALGEIVWQPLAKHIPKQTKRIVISPDGALWFVPWIALPNGNDRLVIDDYALSTVGSGRMLVADSPRQLERSTPSAIFADPDFDQSLTDKRNAYKAVFKKDASPSGSSRAIDSVFDRNEFKALRLPGTAIEAEVIRPNLTKWLSGSSVVDYQGRYALESVVKQVRSPRSLVFATHGYFIDDSEKVFNPLKRCGLLLAGCNDKAADVRDDDGILTGSEIANLQLDGTELVVLSACDTGVGRVENGNGIAGLRRAFHLAGARTVVSTLWSIPDKETVLLMDAFFQELADGANEADALRQAQLKQIKARKDETGTAEPFYWAGFSVSGLSMSE